MDFMLPSDDIATPVTAAWHLPFGARSTADGVDFRVWAPRAERLAVRLLGPGGDRLVPLAPEAEGYFRGQAAGAGAGDDYLYRFADGSERPDPASRWQPDGVHGPSRVVDPGGYPWRDQAWTGLELDDYLIYELHVGTFTPEGTFAALIPRLDALRELGITALQLMPVAQFPGRRNWGYDGVFPFAVQHSYGGPEGLKTLVDACHARGLAVILDVVYNHLGPEGNYLGCFGPYFTDRYRTPWGDAINFDGPGSDPVRHFVVSNALFWLREYHVDALRLDAVHGIFDFSARHILADLAEAVHRQARQLGCRVQVIAESDLNDVRLISPPDQGGYGLDAQWNDDFHHALHALLTGERQGYYADFGDLEQLATAYREGFVYSGQHSRYRRRRHGNSSAGRPPAQLVVFAQNHDQIGNRPQGERLAALVSPEKLRLAAGAVLLAPCLPLLFMGEEYGETAPFPYFIHHGDPELVAAVRRGRAEEFAAFAGQGVVPDPQAEATFRAARLDPWVADAGDHRRLLAFYRELLRLRRSLPALRRLSREGMTVALAGGEAVLVLQRQGPADHACLALFHFGPGTARVTLPLALAPCRRQLDSAAPAWGGPGSPAPERLPGGAGAFVELAPWSFVLYAAGDPGAEAPGESSP